MSSLAGRKSSEDFEINEKFLQKFIERKQSLLEDPKNEMIEDNFMSNQEYSQVSLISKSEILNILTREDLDVNFYFEINNDRVNINKTFSIVECIKEIKKNYKRNDIYHLVNDIQIYFEIILKQVTVKKEIQELKNYDNDVLFFQHYHCKIINNTCLYSMKRVAPFFFIIAVLELCLNKFPALFHFKEKLTEKNLENQKISSLLTKQVRDPYAISANLVPVWCKDICHNFPYLANFNSRYLFFKTCSFEIKRSMTNLYIYVKSYMGENLIDDKTLSLTKRRKIKIDRENLIFCAEKLMKENHSYNV